MKKNCRRFKKSQLKRPSSIIPTLNNSQPVENSVSTASSSPILESFYNQAKNAEFISKDLEKAEKLYRLAIMNNDRVESALKDLASLLHQKNRTLEAIELLKSHESLFVENPKKYENLLISLESQLKCKNFLSKTLKISNIEESADEDFISNLFTSKCRIEKITFASEIEDGRLVHYCIVHFPSHSSARKALTGFLNWNKFCVEWVSDYFEVICDAHYARQKIVNHRKTTPTFDYVLFERETREFLYSLAIDAKYIGSHDEVIESPEELLETAGNDFELPSIKMKTYSYTVGPSRKTVTYTSSQRQIKSSVLAPYSARLQEEYSFALSDEELEIVRVGLFVDILKYEFMQHKGFSSSDWKALFKYWKKHIWQASHWSASKELRKINVRKMIKEGVLTVDTQKRLYGNEAWYPSIIEHEREQTIEWLKQLEPEDVEFTLCYYFEGGLEKIRDLINIKKHQIDRPKTQDKKKEPVPINEPEVLNLVEEMFKKMKGFKSRDSKVLSDFAVSIKENPAVDIELKKSLTMKKSTKKNSLAPQVYTDLDERLRDLKIRFMGYEYEDYLAAFEKRFNKANDLAPKSHSLAPPGHDLGPTGEGYQKDHLLAPYHENQASFHPLAREESQKWSQTGENFPIRENFQYEDEKASFSHISISESSLKPSIRPLSQPSHVLKKPKTPSPARKVQYIKLTSKCFRAIGEPKNYLRFPLSFEPIQPLLPHVKSLVFYMSQFFEDQEGDFSSEPFIHFCLELHFPLFDQSNFPARSLRPGEKYKINEALEKINKQDLELAASQSRRSTPVLAESEVRMLVNLFTSGKVVFMKLNLIFHEFHEYQCKTGQELYNFWDRITWKDRNKCGLWMFDSTRSEEKLSVARFNEISKDRVKVFQGFYNTLAETFRADKEKSEKEKKAAADKLKAKYANPKRKDLYECKQTRWALGKKLLEIEKKFPLDPVVKNMIKVEFTENPLKKFDLEYEAHNEEEELKRKLGKVSIESMKVPTGQKLSQEEKLKIQSNKLRILEANAAKTQEKIKEEKTKEQETQMFKSLNTLVKKYLEYRKSGEGTVATYLSTCYQSLKTQFPLAISKHFPFKNYGSIRKQTDGRMTFDTAYPIEFKHYFFAAFRALLKTPKGLMILKSMPALIWAPSSRSRCTVHIDTCPPDCMYVTLNKKLIRSKLKSEPYTVAWHSKLRPFFRQDMKDEKEKIFMTYADARECTFEPVTGSKVPSKHMALSLKQFSEIRNKINPDEPPNMNMWVNKLGVNLRSAEPGLFKQGIYKQAKALYIQTKYKESKDLLSEHFNIPCILNYFEPGKNRPTINEKPQEDFNKPSNLQLNTNVYQLYCAIKEQFRMAQKQLKTVEQLSIRDPKKTVVKFMCPDPACDKENCEFAHRVAGLRFQQENLIRENYKKKLNEKIKTFQPSKRVPWVPAGSLVDCVNCHATFLYKPKEKTQPPRPVSRKKGKLRDPEIVTWSRSKCCNKCSLEQRLKEKQKNFMEKSKEVNQLILEKSGRNQHDVTGDNDSKQRELLISEKIGQYRKARTLYKQRKYVEAYDVMKKVIEMIRRERSDDSKKVEDRLNDIKNTIGLEITPQVNLNEEDDEPKPDDKKMMLFKSQAERLKQGSSNDFLNYQIETFFLEVEKKLVDENNYASSLRVKAGNLEEMIEGQDEEMKKTQSFLFKPKKVKVCESVLKGKKCKKGAACEFAHFANQLDLVPTTKVIQNFYHTSEVLDSKLKNDVLPPDWKPWRDSKNLPIYPALPLPKDLTKEKDLDKKFPFDS